LASVIAGIATATPLIAACGAPAQPTAAPKPTDAPKAAEAAKPTEAPKAAAQPTEAPKPTAAPAKVVPATEAAGIVAPKAAKGELPDTTIIVAISSGPEADTHTRLAAQFTEYTKGKVKVRLEELPRGTPGKAKVMATMQGKSDSWDVVNVTTLDVVPMVQAGFFVPLKKFQADANLFDAKAFNAEDWPKGLLAIDAVNGEQYAYPQEASTLMCFYRTDLLKKYGVPEPGKNGYSWKELAQHALTLKDKLKADGKTDVYPLLFGVKTTGHAGTNSAQPIWSYGQEIMDDKYNSLYSAPKSVAAMTMMTDFLFKHEVVSPGVVGYEYAEVLTAYQQGKAVIALQWNAAAPTILDASKSPETAGKTGFTVYPYDDAAGPNTPRVYPSVWGQFISAYSKKQEAAFSYITWFTSKEVAKDYVTKGGGSSGRASLLGDPAIVAASPQYPAMLEGFKVYHGVPGLAEFAYIWADIINPEMGAVWSKQRGVQDGGKRIDEQSMKYLKDQGVIK
jgi:ABC-type glycerol-3-phosphate transport system substrate-binding protein